MAKRHVIDYYNKVADQFSQLLLELKSFEEEANKGLFPPERLDEIKKIIQPLKSNYETLSYIIFLLNMPNRKSKESKYRKQIKLHNVISDKQVLDQNAQVINKLKSTF